MCTIEKKGSSLIGMNDTVIWVMAKTLSAEPECREDLRDVLHPE